MRTSRTPNNTVPTGTCLAWVIGLSLLSIALAIALGVVASGGSNNRHHDKPGFVFAWYADFAYEGAVFPSIPLTGQQLGPIDTDNLVREINRDNVDFVIVGGDLGSAGRRNEPLRNSLPDIIAIRDRYIDTLEPPAIVTLSDNDWSEFDGIAAVPGGASVPGTNAIDLLNAWRTAYFPDDMSRGQRRMKVVRQPGYPENQRFVIDGVIVCIFHTIGQSEFENGTLVTDIIDVEVDDPDLSLDEKVAEQAVRQSANVAWLTEAFQLANSTNAPAMIIGTQDTFYEYELHTGMPLGPINGAGIYDDAIRALNVQYNQVQFDGPLETIVFGPIARRPVGGRPVLVLHGDTHSAGLNHAMRYPSQEPFVPIPVPTVFAWEFANMQFMTGNGAARHTYTRIQYVPHPRHNQFPFIVEQSVRNHVTVGDGSGGHVDPPMVSVLTDLMQLAVTKWEGMLPKGISAQCA